MPTFQIFRNYRLDIPSLISILGYADGWQLIPKSLAGKKQSLSTYSEAKLLNFLVPTTLSAFSRALTAATSSMICTSLERGFCSV